VRDKWVVSAEGKGLDWVLEVHVGRDRKKVPPNQRVYESRVLGVEVGAAQDRLRFYAGTAMLLESEERIQRLQEMCDDAQLRREQEAQLREEETRRREEAERLREEAARLREEETRRREEAEREVAQLRAELERLKR
jgi:hypothetical protein